MTESTWDMAVRDIIVIGASAGGIGAIGNIVKNLPASLPASLFVVVHISPRSPGYLPLMLARYGTLNARNAEDGDRFKHGMIYVAPADRHMIIGSDGLIKTPRGPRENSARPAVDPLFRSAALHYGPRVIGVILSGGLDDGTAGLHAIKMCGGTSIVQDPNDAEVSSMPLSAIRNVTIDFCEPVAKIAALIEHLVTSEPATRTAHANDALRTRLELEVGIAANVRRSLDVIDFAQPSAFSCPDCHGNLMTVNEPGTLRFRCHAGHAFTANSLLAAIGEGTDTALWNAVRLFEENAILATHLAQHWRETDPAGARIYQSKAAEALQRADVVRAIVMQDPIDKKVPPSESQAPGKR